MKRILRIILIINSFLTLLFLSISLLACYQFNHRLIQPTKIKQHNSQTNILILGKGDNNHTSPDLTDSIILVNINFKTNKIKFISLPRDIWDDQLKIKINAAYYWGKKENQPYQLPEKVIQRLTGVPVDYTLILDFSSFQKIVDDLGGVWINVPDSFDDYHYPIPGREKAYPISSRYEHIHFDAGWQYMDGKKALIFARSRHAKGKEGNDFARSYRQQLIIRAIINKLLSQKWSYLKHPQKSYHLFLSWWQELQTNLSLNQVVKIAYLLGLNQLKNHQPIEIKNYSFTPTAKVFQPSEITVFGEKVWILTPQQSAFQKAIQSMINP